MSNMQSMVYAPNVAVRPQSRGLGFKFSEKLAKMLGRGATRHAMSELAPEDLEIMTALEAVQSDMDFLHNCFEHATDQVLIDSLSYEIKAAHLKYQYYLTLCKDKGISCGGRYA